MALIRIFCIIFFSFNIALCAQMDNNVVDKIISYIGKNNYQINKNFINSIFKNLDYDAKKDSLKILNNLKINGLLNLKLAKPSDIFITLKTNSSPIFLGYSMNNALSVMGYSYFYIQQVDKTQDQSSFTYTFSSETNIDPLILANELKNRGYNITNIEKTDATHWIYSVNLVSPIIANAILLSANANINANKVSGSYWVDCGKSGDLTISSKNGKKWRPKITFFNNKFIPINVIQNDEEFGSFAIKITNDVKFILITDSYNPTILRDGIILNFSVDGN